MDASYDQNASLLPVIDANIMRMSGGGLVKEISKSIQPNIGKVLSK